MKEKKLRRLVRELHAAVMQEMDEKYDLVYVHYDDKLMDDQVSALVRRDWEALWESMDCWESDARYEGMKYELAQLAGDIVKRMERELDRDLTEVHDEWDGSGLWDEARWQMEERDSGDHVRQLASNTGGVLLRVPLHVQHDENTEARVRAIEDLSEEECVVPAVYLAARGITPTEKNVEALEEIMRETYYDGNDLTPFLLAYVDVGDLYDLPHDCEYVDLEAPWLLMENIWQGSGHDSRLEGIVRVPVASLRTDEDAPGYSWDEVCGLVKSAYTAGITPVGAKKEQAA